jgi:hypothetical protein
MVAICRLSAKLLTRKPDPERISTVSPPDWNAIHYSGRYFWLAFGRSHCQVLDGIRNNFLGIK